MSRLPTLKPGFMGGLQTAPAPHIGPTFSTLHEPLRFFSGIRGGMIHVPRGFPTDFASLRIGDLHLRGKTDRPAVVHDWLYASGDGWKCAADLVFYEACRIEGLGRVRAGLRFIAVLASPGAHRAWRAHRRGTTPGARFVKALEGPQIDSTTNHP